jgi:hypothetical protein
VDGVWLRTLPDESELGETFTVPPRQPGGLITLTYHAIDAPHVGGLAPFLEDRYAQIIQDYAIAAPVPVELSMVFSAFGRRVSGDATGQGISIVLLTPHGSASYSADSLAAETLDDLLWWISFVEFGGVRGQLTWVHGGLIQFERARLAGEEPLAWLDNVPAGVLAGVEPLPLADIWPDTTETPDMPAWTAQQIGITLLVELLVERHGPGALPALLANLNDSDTLDEWLSRSVGVTSADVEAEWQTRLAAAIRQARETGLP